MVHEKRRGGWLIGITHVCKRRGDPFPLDSFRGITHLGFRRACGSGRRGRVHGRKRRPAGFVFLFGCCGCATSFPRVPEGEWRSFGIADRREFYTTTTHIMYTPWTTCGKWLYIGPRDTSRRIHNDRRVTTHAHREPRRLHAWSTDWLTDRSIVIVLCTGDWRETGEASARGPDPRFGGRSDLEWFNNYDYWTIYMVFFLFNLNPILLSAKITIFIWI